MEKKELSQDAQDQIKELQDIIDAIEKRGAFDALFIQGVAGAENKQTRATTVMRTTSGGCHSANIFRLVAELQSNANKLRYLALKD